MIEYFVWGLAGIIVLILVILSRLLLSHRKLEREWASLQSQIQRANEDIAGLCSAAVAVDGRLAANEARLGDVLSHIMALQQTSPVHDEPEEVGQDHEQGYQLAIAKIRQGANIEELMKGCGLTRDEAMLLIRLHGR